MDDNTMNIAYHDAWVYENEDDINEYEDEMTRAEFEWEAREGR